MASPPAAVSGTVSGTSGTSPGSQIKVNKTTYTIKEKIYPYNDKDVPSKSMVYLATDPNDKQVVIKECVDDKRKAFFDQCAQGTMACKDSPLAVRVHQAEGKYLVMDYCGESLEKKLLDRIKKSPDVTDPEWIAQVCTWGLNAAYALKSIHELTPPRYSCDAHLGNFLCDQREIVRIGDIAGSSASLPVAYNSADVQYHPPFEEGKPEDPSVKYDLYVLCQSLALLFSGKAKPRVSDIKKHNTALDDTVIELIDGGREERIDRRKYNSVAEFITAFEDIIKDTLHFEIWETRETTPAGVKARLVYTPVTACGKYLELVEREKMQLSKPGFGKNEYDKLVVKFHEYSKAAGNSTQIATLFGKFVEKKLVPYLQKQLQEKKGLIDEKKKEYEGTKKRLMDEAKIRKRELDDLASGIKQEQEAVRDIKVISDGLVDPQGLKQNVSNLPALPAQDVNALTELLQQLSLPDPKKDLEALLRSL